MQDGGGHSAEGRKKPEETNGSGSSKDHLHLVLFRKSERGGVE